MRSMTLSTYMANRILDTASSYCIFTAATIRASGNRMHVAPNPLRLLEKDGGPGESRTPDQRFRKPLLYPSELQALRGD